MKRKLSALLCCALVLALAGCQEEVEEPLLDPTVTVELFTLFRRNVMCMPDDIFVMLRHYFPPVRSRAPQCGKCLRIN